MKLHLVPICEQDLSLSQAILGDPIMMEHLGGAMSAQVIEQAHRNAINKIAAGAWWFKIITEDGSDPAGTIGIWETDWRDEKINEMGWSILPAFQRKGIASTACRQVLDMAREQKRFPLIYAFPSVTNIASNAICRGAGFVLQEEVDLQYLDRLLRCNVWTILLAT